MITATHRAISGLVLALASGGGAHAQAYPVLDLTPQRPAEVGRVDAPLPVKPEPEAARPAPDLADPADPLAPTHLVAKPMADAVFAKTAIDHRFSRSDDVTGSLGFLCGLLPGHAAAGGAAAFGQDPHGRFVGAKLSFAFR